MADYEARRFEALYREHFRGVLGYALARLEPERAKDAAAETFLVAWRRLRDVPSDPAPWLFGVARKVVAEQLRADSRRAALAERLASPGWQQPGHAADPADQVAQRDAALVALAPLSDRDREALTLLAWHGLSAGQAAQALGVSSLSFAVRLHRARRRLACALAAADTADATDATNSADVANSADTTNTANTERLDAGTQVSLSTGRHADARPNRA